MAGIRYSWLLVVALSGLLLMQGCASTEELFAEYDNKFCVVPEHPDQIFGWEPVVYFASDKSQVFSSDHVRLKTNVDTLNKLTDYKISLKGFADHQASASYNEALSNRRVDAVARYLTDELGLNADRIVRLSNEELTTSTGSPSGTSPGPVAKDRKVEMRLLNSDLVPVATQPLLAPVAVSGL